MVKLLPNSKQIWVAHCEENYVPLYFHRWWMDCVCGAENWNVCLSLDGSDKVEGALVFHLKRRYGLQIITSPPLTTYSGLWINYPVDLIRPSSRMAFEKRVCENLLKQLPAYAFFYQQWHPDITNWLPFFWNGFRQITLYTYRIQLSASTELLIKNMNKSARKRIRQSAKNLKVEITENPAIVFGLYQRSLEKQGLKPSFSFELFTRLDTVLANRHQRKILLAIDNQGNICAAEYLIWDDHATYALLGGIQEEYRHSGALYLLFWEALYQNYGNSINFDFEGSILEPVEESLRSFGGKLTPHFRITRTSNRLFLICSLLLNKSYH